MKKTLQILVLFGLIAVQAQVGINTDAPKATLDVKKSLATLKLADGVIPPILSGDEVYKKTILERLYKPEHKGSMIYLSSVPDIPVYTYFDSTKRLTSAGVYVWDGAKWERLGNDYTDVNIYQEDGTLTGNRLVTMNNFDLTFSGNLKIRTKRHNSSDPNFSAPIILGSAKGRPDNTVFGVKAFANLPGNENTAFIGGNTGFGYMAGANFTTASSAQGIIGNTIIGSRNLMETTLVNGTQNTILGHSNLYRSTGTTMSSNIVIGTNSMTFAKNPKYNIFIGNGLMPGIDPNTNSTEEQLRIASLIYGEDIYSINKFPNGSTSDLTIPTEFSRLGIGVWPEERLDVDGYIRASLGFKTRYPNLIPDYVFQKYYTGKSELNSAYEFKSLNEVEDFIKTKGHLPGYLSAKEVDKQGFLELTQTQLISIEKIEELFLHSIEQEKKINSQAKRIENLEAIVQKLINKSK